MSDNNSAKSTWEGLVKQRPGGWVAGDGYAVGDDPLLENKKSKKSQRGGSDDDDHRSSYTSNYNPGSSYMSRDRYEPSQYGERGYVARDGYERDARSDAYEQSTYGVDDRRYSRDPPSYVQTNTYYNDGARRDSRRSYDDHDVPDYYEKTKVTKYKRYGDERGLAPYDDRDRDRARSQDVAMYRREDRDRESGSRSRGRRDSSGSDTDGEGAGNTPLKKWAATFAGAAVGGMAAQRLPSHHHEGGNWVPTAIGAVIGGLVGREVEKKVYEHKEKREKREHEERY